TSLVEVNGHIPVTLDELIANPRVVLAQPLAVTATIPDAPAPQVLAVFGRTEVTAGTLSGRFDIAGTVAAPTVTGQLTGTRLQVPPGPRGKPIKTLDKLTLDASWDGQKATLVIDGSERNGTLHVAADVSPHALADATVAIDAHEFDLVPLLVF